MEFILYYGGYSTHYLLILTNFLLDLTLTLPLLKFKIATCVIFLYLVSVLFLLFILTSEVVISNSYTIVQSHSFPLDITTLPQNIFFLKKKIFFLVHDNKVTLFHDSFFMSSQLISLLFPELLV
jgi:hypothetical protein